MRIYFDKKKPVRICQGTITRERIWYSLFWVILAGILFFTGFIFYSMA